MGCKHLTVVQEPIPGTNHTLTRSLCKLRLQDELQQAEMSAHMCSLGLEGSISGPDCPVAENGKWQLCPWREL